MFRNVQGEHSFIGARCLETVLTHVIARNNMEFIEHLLKPRLLPLKVFPRETFCLDLFLLKTVFLRLQSSLTEAEKG